MRERITVLIITVSFLWSCNNKIAGTWSNPIRLTDAYDTIMVAALTINLQAKFLLEQQIADQLSQRGIMTSKSSNVFAPNFTDHHNSRDKVLTKIRNRTTNGILTVSIIDSNVVSADPAVFNPDSCRGNFWEYYTSLYSAVYKPRYYIPERTYYIETNLYDCQSEELIWSSRSHEYSPLEISSFAPGFAEYVILKLEKDGVIKSDNEKQSSTRLARKKQPPVALSSGR